MLDLFAIARGNANAVHAAFESVVASLPSEQAALVRDFAVWVEAVTLISVNVKLLVIVEFLNGGRYQNTYEWAQEQSRLSGRSAEDALRERLHEHYEKRVTFDRAFKHGEQFRYGALYGGGAGLPEYDPYCVVLARNFPISLTDIAYLPGDSLKICFAADGSFDPTVIESQSAPHTHRHLLAAKERASEVPLANRNGWPELVASPGRYFEVVFIGDLSLESVEYVRVLKTEYDRMWDMAFGNFGRKLSDAERALVHDFVQMRKGVVDGRIQVEVVS